MARSIRQPPASLIDVLFREAYRFDFFQAVRILRRAARCSASGSHTSQSVVEDGHPVKEPVWFRSSVSLSFPTTEIQHLKSPDTAKQIDETGSCPPEMTVNFMGLTGPCGVLPQHYTEHLIRSKSKSLKDFFDIFNHRTISLFYQAWTKYRLFAAYELAEEPRTDPISAMVASLVGFGTEALFRQLDFAESALQYYAGHFSRSIRPAPVLEDLLSDYFDMNVRVDPFKGHWNVLPSDQQTTLASNERPKGLHAELGINTIIGDQIWDSEGAFRLCIGPVSYKEFTTFMPNSGSRKLHEMHHLTRIFVGPEYEFDVLVMLDKTEVPDCRLVVDESYEPRLGWNTWLGAENLPQHVSDAVFNVHTPGYA